MLRKYLSIICVAILMLLSGCGAQNDSTKSADVVPQNDKETSNPNEMTEEADGQESSNAAQPFFVEMEEEYQRRHSDQCSDF